MKIIVLESKHSDYYFMVNTPEELELSSRKIMKMHLEMGYYEDSISEKVKKYLENPTGKAWSFIRNRSFDGYEYERVSLEEVE